MSRAAKRDEPKAKKAARPARPATVLKPVIAGAALLAAVQAVLPKVL